MIDKILKFYEEYKLYMDLQDNVLPNLIPILENENIIDTLAHINSDEITLETANLYYCSKLFNQS